MRINIEMISYEVAYKLLLEIAPEVAKQMDDTKVIDELLVKLGFASKAPISVDLHINIEELDRLIKICDKEYNDFRKNPNHKWDTPEQERFEDYCDLRNFLILYKNEVTVINAKNELVQLCESLKKNENIKNKLVIDESEKFMKIEFNEYLTLSGDNNLIYMNNDYNHFHFRDNHHFKQFILDITNGETIFIENRNLFSLKRLKGIILQPWNLKIMTRNKYENKKWKYLSKKWLRIYTGNEIIKRDFIDYRKYDNPESKRNLTIKYMEKLNQMLLEDGFKEIFIFDESKIINNIECYILKMTNPNDCTKVINLCILDYPDLSFLDNFYDDFNLALTDDFEMNIKRIYNLLKPILSNEIISVTGLYENRRFGGIYTKEQYKKRKHGDGYSNLKTNIWNGEVDEVN